MAHSISIPPGADIRLCLIAPFSLVLVAPLGTKAEPDMMLRPGVCGLFTFDRGVSWPDKRGCAFATAYLEHNHPIALQFDNLGDAATCHRRMLAEAGQ